MARAKIFKYRGRQAVRLPEEFHFDVGEVEVRKEGDALILRPARETRTRPRTKEEMAAFWAKIDAIRSDDILVLPPQPQLRDFDVD